jgi:photosystem II stability/assembly factor-like uncharacterized protein
MRVFRAMISAFALCASLPGLAAAASPFAALHFRSIGPTTGRIDAVAGVPGNSLTYYAGGLGGLWRTRDGGVRWRPVFDKEPVSSIGAVAVAPSNRKIVYVGTGEPNIRNDIAFGDGMWRSNDGGNTWTHIGLQATSQIAQIAIDPTDANVVYVAAIGDPFKPGAARGIYKTTDGGKHWQRVLYGGERTGASSIVMSPANPKVLFAGLWTVERRPWMLTSGGPRDGLYRSVDAGVHWTRVRGAGFPSGLTGRIGLAFAPSDARMLYAMVESRQGVFWRSTDGGAHWQLMSRNHSLDQRPYYFSQFTVDPKNPNHVFFMSIYPSESFDGGKTIKRMDTGAYDHHQVWIDPVGGKRAIIGADAGVRLSLDGGVSWRDPQLIVSQPYHISVDNRIPYTVCGEFQDPGAACAPSLSFTGSITPDQWFSPQSGESGWIVFSPADSNLIYGTGYEENVMRFDRRTMEAQNISPWPDAYSGVGADAYKYRAAWVAPLAVSPLEPTALYYGTQYVMKTTDGGMTWTRISPDLTRDDASKQIASGRPITVDDAGTEVYDTIACIAESPIVKGELWAGTDDGLAWVSRDGGAHWQDVASAISGLPKWARIEYIDPSPFEDGTAYLVAENHKLGDRTPYLYMTSDFGAHWRSIAGNLPRNSYARMLRADPVRKGMLYAGTENGLWVSFDNGRRWQSLRNNLAHLPIYDIVVQPHFDDLVIATHGRGVWILDDISALQQWTPAVAARAAYLFPVRDAYRWDAQWGTWASDEGAGSNPAGDADIDFFLRNAPTKTTHVSLQVYDGKKLVRTLAVAHPVRGINRVWWGNLNESAVSLIPHYHALQSGFEGPQLLPGVYTVRLTVNGAMQEQPLRVLPDPTYAGSTSAMRAAFAFATTLRQAFRRTGNEIVALRALDAALAKTAPKLAAHPTAAATLARLRSAVKASLGALYISNAQSWEDQLREPSRIYERISNLGSGVNASGYAPTAGQIALGKQIEAQLGRILASDEALFGARLTRLNIRLRNDGIAQIPQSRSPRALQHR